MRLVKKDTSAAVAWQGAKIERTPRTPKTTNTLTFWPDDLSLLAAYNRCAYLRIDPPFDFINLFLDILEPKLIDLENLGVTRDKILFWMLYEYDQQCGMEFHPQEMARLGQSGIHLNIDCWTSNDDKSTTA